MMMREFHIKNARCDKPTHGAVGFNCGRYMTRRLQLMGVHGTKLGNPHPIGYCKLCGCTHNRAQAIEACSRDGEWRKEFLAFEERLKREHHKVIDLWCWCAPLDCHCDVIASWLT